jgi:hypothetical protein
MLIAIIVILCLFALLGWAICVAGGRADDFSDRVAKSLEEERGAPLSDLVQRDPPPQTEFPQQHLSRLHPSVRAAMGRRAQ